MINIIAAIASNGVIGNKGKLPWHIPEDLQHFKELTTGGVVIMGKNTFESIGKVLPDRVNIVVSNTLKGQLPSRLIVCHSFSDAIKISKLLHPKKEVFVIGGTGIYCDAIEYASAMYITEIDRAFEGDTLFPAIDWSDWKKVNNQYNFNDNGDEDNRFNYQFVKYERVV